MGKYQKRTPEELAQWRENQRRLERLIERRLAREEADRTARAKRQPPIER